MNYFSNPERYHAAAARALIAVGNLRARNDAPSARQALTQAQFHIDASQAATPENGFLALHMAEWPL